MGQPARLWATAMASCLGASFAIGQEAAGAKSDSGASLKLLGTAVPVTNLDRTLQFYTRGLGMQAMPPRDTKDVTEAPLTFPGGGPYLILLLPKTVASAYSPPPTQRVILDVADIRALEAQLKANGYALDGPISENVQQHYAVGHVNDPDGNHIELVQRPH